MVCISDSLSLSLQRMDDGHCELIVGGGPSRSGQGVLASKPARDGGGRITRISGGFYQINLAMNFIFGGNNNTITTIQGNDIGSISFKALGGLAG